MPIITIIKITSPLTLLSRVCPVALEVLLSNEINSLLRHYSYSASVCLLIAS